MRINALSHADTVYYNTRRVSAHVNVLIYAVVQLSPTCLEATLGPVFP